MRTLAICLLAFSSFHCLQISEGLVHVVAPFILTRVAKKVAGPDFLAGTPLYPAWQGKGPWGLLGKYYGAYKIMTLAGLGKRRR
ncbi:hypothetical protein ACJMK2_042039 [Sinanodonta woodiana]|uniref:Uncharacterized protein n=1 Tax=Sinanodonta woodiana TaxID=1069815 RepID=A0ABD3W633_SINWO